MTSSLQEDVKNPLKYLYSVSPAYNGLVETPFILPQRLAYIL